MKIKKLINLNNINDGDEIDIKWPNNKVETVSIKNNKYINIRNIRGAVEEIEGSIPVFEISINKVITFYVQYNFNVLVNGRIWYQIVCVIHN